MNHDEVSGSEDNGDSDVECGSGRLGRTADMVDSEEEEMNGAEAQSEDEQGPGGDEEEDDDELPEQAVDEEEEDEPEAAEPESPPPPPPKTAKNTLQNFLKPQSKASVAAAVAEDKKKKAAAAAPAPAASSKAAKTKVGGKASTPVGEPVALGKAGSKSGGKATSAAPKPSKTFTPHSESEEESGEGLDITLPTKKQVNLPAPDPMHEYDEQRTQSAHAPPATASASDVPATVHESYIDECTIFLKNEKVNKWCVLCSASLLYAPESTDGIEMPLDKLTITKKQERTAMQATMFNEQATKVVNSVAIAKMATDGTGSGTGPGMTNLIMIVPINPTDAETEIEYLVEKASEMKLGPGPGGVVKKAVVGNVLDPDLVKRAYTINKCPLPQVYNPNANSSNKYKVPSKLEDQAKFDPNFIMLGPADKPKRAAKRAAESSSAGAASKKSAAPPVAAAHNGHADAAEDEEDEDGGNGIVVDRSGHCFTRMKWTAIPSMGVSMAGIKCAPGADVRLVPAGEGSFILVKTPPGP